MTEGIEEYPQVRVTFEVWQWMKPVTGDCVTWSAACAVSCEARGAVSTAMAIGVVPWTEYLVAGLSRTVEGCALHP